MSVKVIQEDWNWSRFENLFRCPVCMDLPIGIIFQCQQGHHICSECKLKVSDCPQCKRAFLGTRNFICEELLANIDSLRRIITSGLTNDDIQNKCDSAETSIIPNEVTKVQSRGEFPCLISRCKLKKKLPIPLLFTHLRNSHQNNFKTDQSNGETYTRKWEVKFVKGHRFSEAVNVRKMNLFFFIIHITTKGEIRVFTQMVGKADHAYSYIVNYRLSCPPKIHDISAISTRMTSCRMKEEQVHKLNRSLVVANCGIPNHASFTCSVTIKYVGKPLPVIAEADVGLDELNQLAQSFEITDLLSNEDEDEHHVLF